MGYKTNSLGNLRLTAVQTGAYNAQPGDLVACDVSGGAFTVTLPTAPADQTTIGVVLVTTSTSPGATAAANVLTVACGGSDVFTKTGGSATAAVPLTNQQETYIYNVSGAIWSNGLGRFARASAPPTKTVAPTTTYTALAGDIVLATAGAGGFTVTLPAVSRNAQVQVKKVDSGAGTITVSPASGTIDGAASYALVVQYDSVTLVCDGTNWNIKNPFVGNAGQEAVIRANSLNQLATATGNYSMGTHRLTSLSPGIVATDTAEIGQTAGNQYPYVLSGCVWTFSSLNGSMTSGTVVIKGITLTVAAVTSRAFTASDDTYVDLADNGDGTANITYTTATNNSLSPGLANSGTVLNTLRVAVIAAGASTVASSAIYQGSLATGGTTGATLGSSTVAAGSNTNNITVTPLNVTSGASFSTGGGWAQVAHSGGQTYTIQFTGVSSNTLTGVTVLAGSGTVSTGDTVTQIWPIFATDMLGNPIFNTQPYPRMIGFVAFPNAITTTQTAQAPVPGTICPFIVPAGPARPIKVTITMSFVGSSATAGTSITLSPYLGNNNAGGTGVSPASVFKVAVASDGIPVTLLAASVVPQTAGSYNAQLASTQGAAGTLTIGVTYGVTSVMVEYV